MLHEARAGASVILPEVELADLMPTALGVQAPSPESGYVIDGLDAATWQDIQYNMQLTGRHAQDSDVFTYAANRLLAYSGLEVAQAFRAAELDGHQSDLLTGWHARYINGVTVGEGSMRGVAYPDGRFERVDHLVHDAAALIMRAAAGPDVSDNITRMRTAAPRQGTPEELARLVRGARWTFVDAAHHVLTMPAEELPPAFDRRPSAIVA